MLKGIMLSGYRSIEEREQFIAPIEKVNILIGKNNSGKSNILYFLSNQFERFWKSDMEKSNISFFTEIDKNITHANIKSSFGIAINKDEINYDNIIKASGQKLSDKENNAFSQILKNFADEAGMIWFKYSCTTLNGRYTMVLPDIAKLKSAVHAVYWGSIWNKITNLTGGSLEQNWIIDIYRTILKNIYIPKVEFIPAIRTIGNPESVPDDYSGKGVINRLAKLQNPSYNSQQYKSKFLQINSFLREVLENDSITLEVPYERDCIIVHMDNKTLPLQSLGTGIHELVIISTAATILENAYICIEEPELHLHPLLQKKLLDYLYSKTTNKYFITSHSAHILNNDYALKISTRMHNNSTELFSVYSDKDRSDACRNLGYLPSDIIQCNSIIWVEGPSDRIYLNFWIKNKDKKLIEGIHYSIMFYGGRLLSHTSGLDIDESEIENFISLRRLNRNAYIIIDSDKKNKYSRLTATKIRIKNEFGEEKYTWVTKGKEIENYFQEPAIIDALKKVHFDFDRLVNNSIWKSNLEYISTSGKQKVANKVLVASWITENLAPDYSILDLEKRVNSIIKFIHESNI
jgi:predicted ATP-dependent endonuclease of OLD family